MTDLNANHSQDLFREKQLFRYTRALERGDFETVAAVLHEAESDPVLERMILEINEELEAEPSHGQDFLSNDFRAKENIMNVSSATTATTIRMRQRTTGRRWILSPTLAAAVTITILAAALLMFNSIRPTSGPFAGGAVEQTEQAQPEPTTEEENIEISRRFVEEILNGGGLTIENIETILTNSVTHHQPTINTSQSVSSYAYRGYFADVNESFPDGHYTIEHIVAEDDIVTARLSFRGTFTNSFRINSATGNPATGEEIEWSEAYFYRIEGGLIAEIWHFTNNPFVWSSQLAEGTVPELGIPYEAQSLELAQRIIDDIWNSEEPVSYDELPAYGNRLTWHLPNGQTLRRVEGDVMLHYIQELHSAFPDMRVRVDDIFAEGRTVTVRYTFTGTHEGDVYTPPGEDGGVLIPATGEEVTWEGVFIYHMVNTGVAEEWWYWNNEYFDAAVYAAEE